MAAVPEGTWCYLPCVFIVAGAAVCSCAGMRHKEVPTRHIFPRYLPFKPVKIPANCLLRKLIPLSTYFLHSPLYFFIKIHLFPSHSVPRTSVDLSRPKGRNAGGAEQVLTGQLQGRTAGGKHVKAAEGAAGPGRPQIRETYLHL
jgi:hypothetical protein